MLEARQCLVGPAYLLALDREAQEAAFAHRSHLAFGRVDVELEGLLQVSRDAAHHPLARALAFDQDDQVIGIAGEAVSPPLQLAVELVQQDVGQQRRQGPALRRADVASPSLSPSPPTLNEINGLEANRDVYGTTSVLLRAWVSSRACASASDQYAMGAPGVGVEFEDGAERLMARLGTRGLAHMHGPAIVSNAVKLKRLCG